MMPAVRVPDHSSPRVSVEVKLKAGFCYNLSKGVFESELGEVFNPRDELPKKTRIVYKVPTLAKADLNSLSKPERELRRYVQVILPEGESPAKYLKTIQGWPGVDGAWIAPEISLPLMRQS